MKIGIVGAGNVGSRLARKFCQAGHVVLLANSRGPESIREKADEIGVTAVELKDALSDVDAVILSIPESKILQLPKALFGRLATHVPVVDTGNYFPGFRDEPIAAIEAGMPESQWVAAQLGRPVIKAFNSIMAISLDEEQRQGEPERIALPVAGDDTETKRKVMRLVNDVGFDYVDAGSLAESWRQQPGTPAYCTNLNADSLRSALANANRDDAPRKRDLALQWRKEAKQQMTSDDIIKLYRSLF